MRPADRAATGVAAARRASELLRQAERRQQAEGVESQTELVPVIQWVEAPPPTLLSSTSGQQEHQRRQSDKVEDAVSDSQAVSKANDGPFFFSIDALPDGLLIGDGLYSREEGLYCTAPLALCAPQMSMFAAWEAGSLLLDRLADGLLIDAPQILTTSQQRKLALDLLQGCRMRSTRTEFISCPSCGRTLFDIQVNDVCRSILSKLAGFITGNRNSVSYCRPGVLVLWPLRARRAHTYLCCSAV